MIVIFVLLQRSSSSFHSEYLKIIDGNGITVFSRYGYSSVTQKSFTEVSFGNSGNITVQIYLRRSYSNFKLQFGILIQGLQFGELSLQLNSLFSGSKALIFPKLCSQNMHSSLNMLSVTSRFLSPISTVSTINAWDHLRPPLGEHTHTQTKTKTKEKKRKRNACIFRVSLLSKFD